jgi:dephospho-CoA kinase
MIVGLTGGIGSGKTTVLRMFKELGAGVYIADIEAKKLMHDSNEVKQNVIALFGDEAYLANELNRPFIANIVFKDKTKLERLNNIVHPALRNHFLNFVKNTTHKYVIYESAILFENNNSDFCDKIILVTAPAEVRIKRVLDRDKLTREQIQDRMNNQMSDIAKIEKSDYIIENIELEKTHGKVIELHELFLKTS